MENGIKTGAELMRARVGQNDETRDMIDIRARKGFYRDMMNWVVSRGNTPLFQNKSLIWTVFKLQGAA